MRGFPRYFYSGIMLFDHGKIVANHDRTCATGWTISDVHSYDVNENDASYGTLSDSTN